MALNKIVPGSWTNDGTFRHTMEGEDDMPGHVKSSLMGASLNIPVSRIVNGVFIVCELREMFAQMPSCLLEPPTRRGLEHDDNNKTNLPTKNIVCDDANTQKIRNGRLALGTWQGEKTQRSDIVHVRWMIRNDSVLRMPRTRLHLYVFNKFASLFPCSERNLSERASRPGGMGGGSYAQHHHNAPGTVVSENPIWVSEGWQLTGPTRDDHD